MLVWTMWKKDLKKEEKGREESCNNETRIKEDLKKERREEKSNN